MSVQDKFDGAKNGLGFYLAYFDAVADKLGMDKAMELSVEVDQMLGAEQGKMIKEQSVEVEYDTVTAAAIAKNTIEEGFGILSEVVSESPEKTVLRCKQCPVYDAAQELGIETDKVETMCQKSSLQFMDAMVKQLNPKLSYRLNKFRTSSDDYCEEEIVME